MLEISNYTKNWCDIQHISIKEHTEEFLLLNPHPHFYKEKERNQEKENGMIDYKKWYVIIFWNQQTNVYLWEKVLSYVWDYFSLFPSQKVISDS